MVGLVLQEVDLLGPFLVLRQLLLLYLLLQRVFLLLQLLSSLLEPVLLLLQLQDRGVELRCTLLSLQLLPHREGQRALVEGFVCADGHVELVPHPHQQDASLGRIDGDLPDDLVEALLVQLLADGAYARVSELKRAYLACLTTSFSSSSFCSVLTSSREGGLVLMVCLKCLPSPSHSTTGNILFSNSE